MLKFAVCRGLGDCQRDRKVSSVFVPSGVKLNSQRYTARILEGCLLPWAKKHLQGVPWSLQQDFAPSHASKISQSWILR